MVGGKNTTGDFNQTMGKPDWSSRGSTSLNVHVSALLPTGRNVVYKDSEYDERFCWPYFLLYIERHTSYPVCTGDELLDDHEHMRTRLITMKALDVTSKQFLQRMNSVSQVILQALLKNRPSKVEQILRSRSPGLLQNPIRPSSLLTRL